MAKQRFRDIKQGKVTSIKEEKKEKKITKEQEAKILSTLIATNKQKVKSALTDAFMLLMPIMYIVFYLVMGGREGFAEDKMLGWIYILVPLILIQTAFMWFGDGQTPGYRNYQIRVVDSVTLEKPPLISIIFRNILMVMSLVTIVGWLMMFFRKDRKGLHDIISQTMVINAK